MTGCPTLYAVPPGAFTVFSTCAAPTVTLAAADTTPTHLLSARYAAEMQRLVTGYIAYDVWEMNGWDHIFTKQCAIVRRATDLLHHGYGDPRHFETTRP